MSIDKFGRSASSSNKIYIKGTPGIGFKLNSDGNFDLQKKQLKNLKNPLDPYDGATKIYVDNLCNEMIRNNTMGIMEVIINKEDQLNKKIINNFTDIKEYVNIHFNKMIKNNNEELLETLNLRVQLAEQKLQNQISALKK